MAYTTTKKRKGERVQMFSALDEFSMGEALEKPEDVLESMAATSSSTSPPTPYSGR